VAATRPKELLVINRVPYDKFDKSFVAPFFTGPMKTKTVKIDVGNLSISPGKLTVRPKPNFLPKFEKELKKIEKVIPEAIKTASVPSLSVISPSTGQFEGGEEDIQIQVIYDETDMDFHVEGASAATIGTLTHKLMETNPSNLQKAARTLIENEKVALDPSDLVARVKALRKKALLDRLKKAKTILREVPIKFKGSGDDYYDGNIDLLFEEDDGWVIVDYKAITIGDEEEEQKVQKTYRAQMEIYSEGLKQVGIEVKERLIVSC